MTTATIRPARPADCSGVAMLLKSAGLPIADIDPQLADFFVAEDNGAVVGAVGAEMFGDVGLLRSLAVASSHRNRRLGRRLCERAINSVHARGITQLFLLTTDASRFFEKLAFVTVDRRLAPAAILSHQQFTQLCPDSAILMEKKL